MKQEQKQELTNFLTIHAYPKIVADTKYIEEIKDISNHVKDDKTPYTHLVEEQKYQGDNIAEFVREKNSKNILPIFSSLTEHQLESLICNTIEPVSYIIAANKDWAQTKEKINKFELGRIGLELFD